VLTTHTTITVVLRVRLLPVVLALAVGGIRVAPPEHVHEAEEHGHAHLLVHRHLAPHTADHHHDGHDRNVDDNDAPVLTLDAVYTVPAAAPAIGAAPSVLMTWTEPPAVILLAKSPEYFERLIHGPPRAPTGLRAPPRLSRL
jgi:hypothetical protein